MGKNKALKTLGKIIGNIVLHKILAKYTNNPESVKYLINEENEYRATAINSAKKFNWNKENINEIKNIAIEFFKNKSVKKYPDVTLPLEEAKVLIDNEIKDLEI